MRSFEYLVPDSVAAAVDALAVAEPGTKILAGGTTLYDLMKVGVEAPPAVIDIHRLAELTEISTGGDELSFGAGVKMADVADHPVVRRDYPALSEALWRGASQQLRNMATVGGNLLQRTRCSYFRGGPEVPCNKRNPGSGCAALEGFDRGHAMLGTSGSCIATYPSDMATALIAFDAVIDVAGPEGERTLPLGELHVEPGDEPWREHTLAADELILRIRIPATPAGRGSTYLKIRDRESYAFALTSAAAALTLDAQGIVTDCRIGLGGVATRPWRASAAERSLIGGQLTEQTARHAGEVAYADAEPRVYGGFRIELGIRTVADALLTAGKRAI
ncbi:FAD binding domain-containing protein [Streptomyces sp. NPDC090088]|uniref:FAD binding domain-containing protein n=1 Tax=Streptomyces sp. NPDC090088 TaxID=3365944 RepID=UPI0038086D32